MNEIQEPDKCQHEGCSCPLPETGTYCSEHCEKAASGDLGQGCQCGHAECVA